MERCPKNLLSKILGSLLIIFLHTSQLFAETIIIGNKKTTPDELRMVDMRLIFLGEKKAWEDNISIKLALYTRRNILEEFTNDFTKKPLFLFQANWKRRIFTGRNKAPKGFGSEKELIQYVSITEGAIGFVTPAADIKNVKIIKIVREGEK